MKLLELGPRFLKLSNDTSWRESELFSDADGIQFSCPLCYQNKGNSLQGVHSIICWQPQVPQTIYPVPGRWSFFGTGFNDLELKAGSSSILLTGGCKAHFFIRNGEIIMV